jgi:hypothetical protein
MKLFTWFAVGLGVWLIASPIALGYSLGRPAAITEDLIPGLFLLGTSMWLWRTRTAPLRIEWLHGLCGLWLVVGSFVLLFSRIPRGSLNNLLVGFVLLTLSVAAESRLLHEAR